MQLRTQTFATLVALCALALPVHSEALAEHLLVVNKSGHSLSLLDTTSKKEVQRFETGQGPHEVEINASGSLALVSNYGTDAEPGNSLTVVNLIEMTVSTIDLGEHSRPHGIAWLTNARAAVTTEGTNSIVVVDAVTGRVVDAVETDGEKPHMVVADANGQTLWVANIVSGTVTKLSTAPLSVIATKESCEGAEGIALSTSDPALLWVAGNSEGVVKIHDASTLEEIGSLEISGMPIRVELLEDRQVALITSAVSGKITAVDTESYQVLHEISTRGYYDTTEGRFMGGVFGLLPVPVGAQASGDGERFYVANSYGGVILEIDSATFEVLGEFVAGAEPDGMAIVLPRAREHSSAENPEAP